MEKTEPGNAFLFYNPARTIGRVVRSILLKTHHELFIFFAETFVTAGLSVYVKSFNDERKWPHQNINNCGFAWFQSYKMKTSAHSFTSSFDLVCFVRLIILKCKFAFLKIIPVLG